ncbi:2-oxoglutarate dehydrogenase E1 subunit family protein, partial [Jatrophihabitans sp. YIM 134969]
MTTTDLTSHTSSSDPEGFGPNEWLVEEMYERYRSDPDSVDPAWHDFFSDYRGPAGPTDSDVDPEADEPGAAPASDDTAPAASPATSPAASNGVAADAPAPTPSAR